MRESMECWSQVSMYNIVQRTLDIDRWHNIVTVSYCVSLLLRRLRFQFLLDSFDMTQKEPSGLFTCFSTVQVLYTLDGRDPFLAGQRSLSRWCKKYPCGCIRLHPLGMTFLPKGLFRRIVDGFDGLWMDCDLEPCGAMGAEDTLGLSPSRIRGSKFEQWQSKRKSDPQLWRQRSLFVIRLCQTLGTFWHSTCREVDLCDLARILVLFHSVFIKYRHN